MKKTSLILLAFAWIMTTTASSCPEKVDCESCTYTTTDGQVKNKEVCSEFERTEFLTEYADFSPECP